MAKYNISIQQSASYSTQFIFLTPGGNPLDLTGYSVASELRSNYTDAQPASSFTSSIVSPPTSGTIQLNMSPDTSGLLTGSCYYYDVALTLNGEVIRPIGGKAVVQPSVTR